MLPWASFDRVETHRVPFWLSEVPKLKPGGIIWFYAGTYDASEDCVGLCFVFVFFPLCPKARPHPAEVEWVF